MANSTLRKFYTDILDGVSAPKNYITNAFAVENTNGWALYSNTAANIPSTGTGGTATGLTFSRNTSSPIRNLADFKLVQANSTSVQGKGLSFDFTIDPADQSKILTVSLDYSVSATFIASDGVTTPINDGTTSTNSGNSDLEFFIYDKTNSVLIPVTSSVLTSTGNDASYRAVFQTSSNSTSYRLIIHAATSNANATGWSFEFSNVFVGNKPSIVSGIQGTDWIPYTPTFVGIGTPTNINVYYRRVGDTLEAQGALNNGTDTAVPFTISLPSGLLIDSAKMSSLTNGSFVGTVYNATNSAIAYGGGVGVLFFDGSDTSHIYGAKTTASTNFNKDTGTGLFNSNSLITFSFSVPIAGWSSSGFNLINSVVAFAGTDLSGPSTGGNLIVTPSLDTHSAYNVSTGIYTVPISGIYYVSAKAWITSNDAPAISIFQNGAQKTEDFFNSISNNSLAGGKTYIALQCTAGDQITVQVGGGFTLDGGLSNINIFRIANPEAVPGNNYAFIGSAYINTGASHTTTNTTIGPFGTGGGGTPTIELNPGPGVLQTGSVNLPQITVNGIQPGTYKVRMSVTGDAGGGNLSLAINDGTTTSGFVGSDGNQNKRHELVAFFKYTSGGNITYQLYGSNTGSTTTIYAASVTSDNGWKIGFSIERVA